MKRAKTLLITALVIILFMTSVILSSCSNAAVTITKDNVKTVMADILPGAADCYRNVRLGKYKTDSNAETKTFNDCSYALVADSSYNTLDKVKTECLKYYSKDYAEKNIFTALSGDNPVYKEFDGKLYLNIDGSGYGCYSYSTDSAELVSSDDNGCTVKVDCIDDYEVSCTATLGFIYENGAPKINTAEYIEK